MSQPLIAARNASARALRTRPSATQPRPALRVVTPPALAARVPLPLLCVLLLTAGLLTLLMLNISIARDAFTISTLQRESTLLSEQQQSVDESIARRAAPQALHDSAAALGMVPAPAPVHLTGDGTVGEPQPAPTPSAPPADAPR